ncbi:MAG: S24 family peptidase [Gammaproteobacteria bacterium]
MKINNFADRLNLALDKEGFPPKNRGRIQLLAEMVGLTHRGASKWINAETCPPTKKYASLAKKLNVKEEWLKTGQEPMLEESIVEVGEQDGISIIVPVYHVEDFLSQTKAPIQTINCNLPTVGKLFAIQLETEAMSPRFPKESIIIFDDEKQPKDGDFVFVDFDNYPVPLFRQLLITGSSRYLNAHNPKFDRLLITEKNKVYGTMIQAILSFI